MNERLKIIIGEPVTVITNLSSNTKLKEEYIQGILKAVEDDILCVEQHINFCNIFNGKPTTMVERRINT